MSPVSIIMRTLMVAAAWLFLGTAYAAYKCVGPDGRVVYTDTPCATNTKQSEVRGTQQRTAGLGPILFRYEAPVLGGAFDEGFPHDGVR